MQLKYALKVKQSKQRAALKTKYELKFKYGRCTTMNPDFGGLFPLEFAVSPRRKSTRNKYLRGRV